MLIATLAVSASTSRRPVGSFVMRNEPSMTKMPARSIFSLAFGLRLPFGVDADLEHLGERVGGELDRDRRGAARARQRR